MANEAEMTTEQEAKSKRGMTRAERILALEKRAREIQDRARDLRAQERASKAKADRKADTHRKVVLGAAVFELIRLERLNATEMITLVDGLTTFTDRDRETMRDAIRGALRVRLDDSIQAADEQRQRLLSSLADSASGSGSLPPTEA